MLFPVKAYLKFLWRSKNEYSVHSPFVFDLLTKCFYDVDQRAEYKTLEKYRESLLSDDAVIEVTDFGAGSRVFKSNKRKISAIAKNAGISPERAALLFRVANYFMPDNVLEIGTSLGLATSALALGNPDSTITTIEGCPATVDRARRQLKTFGMTNVESAVTEFADFLRQNHGKFGLVYFDGNHSLESTLEYFELLLPSATNDSVWIFDDIHWSDGMEQAWETIKKHPRVTVTIDTFQWGFVFFRKEQPKQDFVIRC